MELGVQIIDTNSGDETQLDAVCVLGLSESFQTLRNLRLLIIGCNLANLGKYTNFLTRFENLEKKGCLFCVDDKWFLLTFQFHNE